MGSKTIKLNTGGGKTEFELSPSDVDLGKVPNVKQNLTATRDPTSSDDTDSGYSIGSRWVNTSSDAEFVCLDASSGAAVWIETTQSGGSSGGGLTWQVISSNTTASAGNGYLADVSGSTLTLTLPSSPSTGDKVGVCDFYGNSGTNAITVDRNGNNIEGSASNYTINTNGKTVVFCYTDSTRGWEIIHETINDKTDVNLGNVPNEDATDMANWDQKSASDGQAPVWDSGTNEWTPKDVMTRWRLWIGV